MALFKKILPYYKAKGLLIGVVYLTLSIFFVFFVPKTVPAKAELEIIKVAEDKLDLAYNKKANTSYFTGTYKGAELRSATLTLESGLKLYGTNEFFIQMKKRPEFYELMIYKDTTLLGKRYTIYQLSDEKEILIPYDFTAQIEQKQKNQFFFLGLACLAFFGFILINTLIKKIKESKSGDKT